MNAKHRKPMIIMIIFLVILFGLVFGWYGLKMYFMARYFATFEPPPVTITAAQAQEKQIFPKLKTVGTLVAVDGIDVTTEASGIIEKILFQSGTRVKQGQPLIKLDTDEEEADLKNNEAQLKLNRITYQRMIELYAKRAVSKSQLDEAEAKLTQSEAQVSRTQAEISQKNITAPFSGMLGIKKVNLGQYVSPGTALVPLTALKPIYVDFYLPEQELTKVQLNQTIEIKVATYPEEKFMGKITAINARVDVATHNILLQGTLPNAEEKLFPGFFANVEVLLPQRQKVIMVPKTAITFSLFGDTAYVVYKDGKDKDKKDILRVKQQFIKTGDTIDGEIIVTEGIKPGEMVATSGQLKLDNKTRVVIDNKTQL